MAGRLRGRVACLWVALLLSGCQAAKLPPPDLPRNMQPITTSVTIGSSPIDDAVQTEVKTITFGEGPGESRMVITSRSLMDTSYVADILRLRSEVLDTDVTLSGMQSPATRNLVARLKESEGTVIEFRHDLQSGQADVRVIQNGAMVTLTGEAASKVASLVRQSYLGGQTVTQGQRVMELDLSAILSGPADDAGTAKLFGRVLGKALYNGRLVVVVGLDGVINAAGTTVQAAGTYLVDRSTGIAVHGNLVLAGMQSGNEEISVAITQEVRL